MRYLATIVAVAMFALALYASAAACEQHNNGGQTAAPPTAEQASKMIASKLDMLRNQPDSKPQMIAHFREKAINVGGSDQIDKRMTEIAAIFDLVISSPEDEYLANRDGASKKIWYWMSGQQ